MFVLAGEGARYPRASAGRMLSDLTPVELIRHGLEKLEDATRDVAFASPGDLSSDYVAVSLYPLDRIGTAGLDPSDAEGHIMAYRPWVKNPAQTIAVRIPDEAMHPILPAGSIVAIDLSMTDPGRLQGRIVAANPAGRPMIRWLEVSGRHLILRPNVQSRDFPLIPIDVDQGGPSTIIGSVAWSWSRFSED
jgi:hypothetical protein